MRIGELSRVSGVPVPTIKYYLREGLLPAGETTAPNQAEYSDHHLRRLRLIRALTQVGGMSLRAVQGVLEAVEDERMSQHELMGVAHYALSESGTTEHAPGEMEAAKEIVDEVLETVGWRVSGRAPGRAALADAVATLRQLGTEVRPEGLSEYAKLTDRLAAWEVEHLTAVGGDDSREGLVEGVVVGTVLFERVLVALRRLAQEHHSASRYGD